MENLISIFLFLSIFTISLALLYKYILKDKEIEKRLNYYLDIEDKYKAFKGQEKNSIAFKEQIRNINEYIREIMKKGLPHKDQKRIEQQLLSAGVNVKPEEYIASRILCAMILGLLLILIFNFPLFFVVGAVIGFYIPELWVSTKRKARVDKFNDGLADMITTIVGSLRAGYSFSQALKTVSEESESPIKEEIRELITELNYGITLEEAFNNLKLRMPSVDLELMIHAVLIQKQIGGNLSLILETIVNTIRERKKLQRHVKTLTAQGRLSGRVIAALPLVVAFIMYMTNRDMIVGFVTNRYGQIAIAIGLVMCIIGFVTINKITKLEV
ncbi:MAG: type II secretion system F family protein [Clostridiaceae bacterium]